MPKTARHRAAQPPDSARPFPRQPAEASGISDMDIRGFRSAVEDLRAELTGTAGEEDYGHLRKIEWYGRLFTLAGFATAWIIPNPVSAFAIHMGISTRFLLLHVVGHGGYDDIPGIPRRYTSKGFGHGWRRYLDFMDWWPVDTWHRQHNGLHHYHTGEVHDPDMLERHARPIARLRAPEFIKRFLVFLLAATWKFTAYVPNAMSLTDGETKKWLPPDQIDYLTFRDVLRFRDRRVRALWTKCYLPYIAFHFVAIPLAFLPLGSTAALFVLLNRLLAEVITNLHSALVIFPSHAGDDLYTYRFHHASKEEFYATQVMATANYRTGTEFVDYMSMWLNYQIEHHLFPRVPMLKYRTLQPRVKEICRKFGIPYVEESVFRRARRAAALITGAGRSRKLQTFPLRAGNTTNV